MGVEATGLTRRMFSLKRVCRTFLLSLLHPTSRENAMKTPMRRLRERFALLLPCSGADVRVAQHQCAAHPSRRLNQRFPSVQPTGLRVSSARARLTLTLRVRCALSSDRTFMHRLDTSRHSVVQSLPYIAPQRSIGFSIDGARRRCFIVVERIAK
jgi:hypothetical protein